MMDLSRRASMNPESGIREMFSRAGAYNDVINLGIGEPDYPTQEKIIQAAIDALKGGLTKYTPNAGIPELREALMKKLARENGLKGSGGGNVIVTTGACEAIILSLFAVTDPGDEVIIPVPSWPNYIGQVMLAGLSPVVVPTFEREAFHLNCEFFENAITEKTRALIINSPSNPTGAVLTGDELEKIGMVARKHDIVVLSDEPYEKFVYNGRDHVSMGSLDGMEEYVLTINSFSKTYTMTGWRVGYVHGPENIVSKMGKLQENFSSCVNTPSQYACIEALNVSEKEINKMRSTYAARRKIIVEGLNSLPNVSCAWPEGSFYVFPNISLLGRSSREVAIEWLEECRVMTVPGTAFGSAGEGYLRMSFAAGEEAILEAIERLRAFL